MKVLLETDGQPTLDDAIHRTMKELVAPRTVHYFRASCSPPNSYTTCVNTP